MFFKQRSANLVKRVISKALAPPAYLNPSFTVFSESQGQRDFKIQQNLNEMNFRGMTVNAVYNRLVTPNVSQKEQAYMTQAQMPWNSQFMVTPSQGARLNNNPQKSFVEQPQMSIPNVYGQFYAFMNAASAAFGTLQK